MLEGKGWKNIYQQPKPKESWCSYINISQVDSKAKHSMCWTRVETLHEQSRKCKLKTQDTVSYHSDTLTYEIRHLVRMWSCRNEHTLPSGGMWTTHSITFMMKAMPFLRPSNSPTSQGWNWRAALSMAYGQLLFSLMNTHAL